jgi:hypothetical protein
MEVRWTALPLSIQQPCKGFDISHRVTDRNVIVGSRAKPLPALAVVEISDQAGIEVADASAGIAKRIATDGMVKAVIDPLKVVCRVITERKCVQRPMPIASAGA